VPWIGDDRDVETSNFLWDYVLPVLLVISLGCLGVMLCIWW
jgi:hypothetical protein